MSLNGYNREKIPSTVTNMAEGNLGKTKVSFWVCQVMKEIPVYLAFIRDAHWEDLGRCMDITKERESKDQHRLLQNFGLV